MISSRSLLKSVWLNDERSRLRILLFNSYSSRTRRIWADIYNQRGRVWENYILSQIICGARVHGNDSNKWRFASKFKIYSNGSQGGGFSSFTHTATSRKCLPCGLTVIHLRLCDRKQSLGTSHNLNWRGEWRRNCFLSQIISRLLLNSTHVFRYPPLQSC